MLDDILKYHETPQDDDFVAGVIKSVRHQQRMRRLILTVTGLTGACFGAFGVVMISDGVNRLITDANVLPVSVALVGFAAFMTWLFQDETTAVG
jgi:predicted secreted protein